jgi:Flp pilus assembly protein TadG
MTVSGHRHPARATMASRQAGTPTRATGTGSVTTNPSRHIGPGQRLRPHPRRRMSAKSTHRLLWSRWCRLARGDRGSATAFGLFLIVVVLVLAGAMIEGGNAMSARGHATDVAQQAARAGADKLDLAVLRNDGLVRIDPAAAQSGATAFLAQVGETGTVTATPTQVFVAVTVTRPGILVPILGIKTLTVRATATAAPITG